MEPESSPVEHLRDAAATQGVHPTEEDLEGVRGFLDLILPALAEIEDRLPPDTVP
jgi:hypothetical protein